MLKKNLGLTLASATLVVTAPFAQASSHSTQAQLKTLEKKMANLQRELNAMHKTVSAKRTVVVKHQNQSAMLAKMERGGVTISTTPTMGLRNGNVLYSVPTMNEDLRVLKQKQLYQTQLEAAGGSLDNHARVGLSGAVEGQLVKASGWRQPQRGNTDLSTMVLDMSVFAGNWVNSFVSLAYDGSSVVTGARVPANRVYLKRAWVTVGNLVKSPYYFSIGQMFVPFGRYSSAMLTTTLTQSLARISSRSALVGYSKGPVYAEFYGYNSLFGRRKSSPVNEWGVNVGTQITTGDITGEGGIGFVSNIGDSEGASLNGIESTVAVYQGFAAGAVPYSLVHNVPGFNANLQLTQGDWTVAAEYVTSLRSYAAADMYYSSTTRGARVGVVHTEVDYATHFMGRPAVAAITYGRTWEAAAMNLPRQSVSVVYDVHPWKCAAVGAEFRHDFNYKNGVLSGGGYTDAAGVKQAGTVTTTGGSRNVITMRFGVYF